MDRMNEQLDKQSLLAVQDEISGDLSEITTIIVNVSITHNNKMERKNFRNQ
jgi:hypothetical protein